jgi:hypothetical protein
MNNLKPFHSHDCEKCTHLTSISKDDLEYDLYFCTEGFDDEPYCHTVIARFGEYGAYMSGLEFSDKGPLKEAAMLAIEAGLLDHDVWVDLTRRD